MDTITRLRELSACKHDDLSVGDEAADLIEELTKILEATLGILTAKQRERQFPNIYAKAQTAIKKARTG